MRQPWKDSHLAPPYGRDHLARKCREEWREAEADDEDNIHTLSSNDGEAVDKAQGKHREEVEEDEGGVLERAGARLCEEKQSARP